MKMTLDQLRVDSYATQVNENELTEVKGGTTAPCLGYAVAAAAVTAAGAIAVAVISAGNDHKECGTEQYTYTGNDGCKVTVTKHLCKE